MAIVTLTPGQNEESEANMAAARAKAEKAKPGMERSLSQQQVVDAAFEMIDKAGYKNFSMRTLAEKLGMGTMSIYTYVPSKQQLMFLVIQKMMSEYDNAPVPGEYWEDTLHRTCESLLAVNLRHANVRIMQLQTQLNPPQQHQRSIYYLHADQGMPADVYEIMYGVLRSFLTGFIDVAAKRKLELVEQGDDSNMGGEWSRISASDTEIERFRQGVDFIIAGTRALASPNPCDWRTPEDTSTWTWGREE